MRKMTVIIISAALAAVLAAGCSGGSDTSSSSAASTDKSSAASSQESSNETAEASTEAESSKSSDASESDSSEASSESSKSDSSKASSESSKSDSSKASSESSKADSTKITAAITYNDVEIKVGAEVSALLDKLGTPDHKETIETESESSEETYSYTYDNMTIYSYVKDKKEYTADITVSGIGLAATANGIVVGSTRAEVADVYGETGDDSSASFDIGDSTLIFIFEDDEVTNISLVTGIGDE